MIVCTEIKQKQPQDRKTVFQTLSPPVAEILSMLRDSPKGPKIEENQSRLKFSISLEIFNPDLQNSHKK